MRVPEVLRRCRAAAIGVALLAGPLAPTATPATPAGLPVAAVAVAPAATSLGKGGPGGKSGSKRSSGSSREASPRSRSRSQRSSRGQTGHEGIGGRPNMVEIPSGRRAGSARERSGAGNPSHHPAATAIYVAIPVLTRASRSSTSGSSMQLTLQQPDSIAPSHAAPGDRGPGSGRAGIGRAPADAVAQGAPALQAGAHGPPPALPPGPPPSGRADTPPLGGQGKMLQLPLPKGANPNGANPLMRETAPRQRFWWSKRRKLQISLPRKEDAPPRDPVILEVPVLNGVARLGPLRMKLVEYLGGGTFGQAFRVQTQEIHRDGTVKDVELVLKNARLLPLAAQYAPRDYLANARHEPGFNEQAVRERWAANELRTNPQFLASLKGTLEWQIRHEFQCQQLIHKQLPERVPQPIYYAHNQLVMEVAPGKSLGNVGDKLAGMRAGQMITAAELVAIAQFNCRELLKISAGLERAGLTHRDISAGNINLSSKGWSLLDMGNSKQPGQRDADLWHHGLGGGTPGFVSANFLASRQGSAESRHTDDLYSLASCALYALSPKAWQRVQYDQLGIEPALREAGFSGKELTDFFVATMTTKRADGTVVHDPRVTVREARGLRFLKMDLDVPEHRIQEILRQAAGE